MGKHFFLTLLLGGCVVISRAQSPSLNSSPSPTATPQTGAAAVAATPTPAPVLEPSLIVSISEQKLAVVVNDKVYKSYKISTSRYGEGDAFGSWCTPIGHLAVATKIGGSVPFGGVFERRRYTGEILSVNAPGRDPIVSRIIWLRGLDYTNKNAFHRCIYIHGTPQEDALGKKASYGCIRMRSSDIIELFNWVTPGTEVAIADKPIGRAVKDLVENRRLVATNTIRPEIKSVFVR
ncbi:MAG: L,D-transpeptidase [Verrucomicrobia bacterium]|nr:L,D-transpeptidase [Verrucomicrobiota bacterium]